MLSYQVGSIDRKNIYFQMTCLSPTQLPLSYFHLWTILYNIKICNINITACLETPQNQNKKISTKTIYHEAFWSWFSRFLSPPLNLCHNSFTRFPQLIRPPFLLLDDLLCCPYYLLMEYFDTSSFLVSAMGEFPWFS